MEICENNSLNHGYIFIANERISIGHNVQFEPNVLISDYDHDYKKENGLKKLYYITSPIEIGNNIWIGANVVILKGLKIGKNCVIAVRIILSAVGGESYPDNSLKYQKKRYICNRM